MTIVLADTTCPACDSTDVDPEAPASPDVQRYCCMHCGAEWTESTEVIDGVECY